MRKLICILLFIIQACEMPTEEKLPNLNPLPLAEYQYKDALTDELQQIDIEVNKVELFLRAFKEKQKLEAWVST